jgi:hypothetical protein
MAQTLQLEYGGTTIDLLSGDLRLERGGWSTRTTRDGRVWETLSLVSNAADATIRATQIDIDQFFEYARAYEENILESTPVWLKWRSDGELEKRALVYDGETELKTDDCVTPLLGVGGMRLTIAIERDKAWEEPGVYTVSTTNVNHIGGTWTIGSDIGSMAQRISKFTMTAGGTSKGKFWMGIRDIRNGTTGFISKWEAEDGGVGTDTALAADATASPGGGGNTKITCTFATVQTLALRSSLSWAAVQTVGNYDDIVGSYLVLARMKLDAGTTEVAVQLQYGWGGLGTGTATPVGTTFLSAVDDASLTNWNFIELGSVDFPPTGNRDDVAITNDEIKEVELNLWAERISVAGSLDLDCYVLIPNEHLFVAKAPTNLDATVDAWTGPDGFQYCLGKDGTTYGNMEYSFNDWYYPVGGGIMVIAVQASTISQNLTDVAAMSVQLYPRWKTFRETVAT